MRHRHSKFKEELSHAKKLVIVSDPSLCAVRTSSWEWLSDDLEAIVSVRRAHFDGLHADPDDKVSTEFKNEKFSDYEKHFY